MSINNLFILNGHTGHKLLEKINVIKNSGIDNLVVLADFDKTFTIGNSYTSWSLLSRSGLVDEQYTIERDRYYEINKPIEVDTSLPFEFRKENTRNWWLAHLNLILKYNVTKQQIDKVVYDNMKFRDGAQEFIKILHENNIPLIIVSAGIGNFIQEFLSINNLLLDNISIEANFLTFDSNGVVNGIDKTNIIHSLNKDNHVLKDSSRSLIGNRYNAIIIGDNIEDIKIKELVSLENYLGIGVLPSDGSAQDFENTDFDCVCIDESFDTINDIMNIMLE